VTDWVRRVVALETRLPVTIASGPDVTIRADGDQLDQLLINLVRNAVDASLTTRRGRHPELVRDNGDLLCVWKTKAQASQARQPLRAVLYDQAAGLGYRPGAIASDRGSTRRHLALDNRR